MRQTGKPRQVDSEGNQAEQLENGDEVQLEQNANEVD